MKSSIPFPVTLTVCLALLLSVSATVADDEAPGAGGGTITGIVKLKGKASGASEILVTKDHTSCGQKVVDETLVVRKGLIQNVVVSIDGITTGKKADKKAVSSLNNVKCRFVPHVQTIQVGASLMIENADTILHNTHGTYDNGRTAFNLALPRQGLQIKKRIKKSGIITMKCDAGHTWMNAYVFAFKHSYHSVTGEDGSFSISDVPPGKHTLSIWHETLPAKTIEVVVEKGKTVNVTIELEKGK